MKIQFTEILYEVMFANKSAYKEKKRRESYI